MNATPSALRAYRILAIEDSPDDVELMAFALRGAPFSFSMERVETEEELAAALDAQAPDVILCDYHLPRFDMGRALKMVREERNLEIPFIVVSRHIGEDAAVEAMQRGANDYLLKGRLGRLPTAIATAVERNQARREMARAEQALRRSDLLNRSLLNSISMRIAVVDSTGTIIASNRAWQRSRRDRGPGAPESATGLTDLQRFLAGPGGCEADEMRRGIEAVMRRQEPRFAIEYEVACEGAPRWEMLRAEPLEDSEQGAVVSVEDITPRMLTHLALRDAHRRLQQLSKRVLSVQEEERRAIALELHDDIGQSLAAQKIALHHLAQRVGPSEAQGGVRQCLDIAEDVLEKVRRLSYSLRPPHLDQLGLDAALQSLAKSQGEATGVAIECRASGLDRRLPSVVEGACYRIAQEALNNATRHGNATGIAIEAQLRDRMLRLAIRDNGGGFDEQEARARALRNGSLGLVGMAERAELAGGRLKVRSVPGAGTVVSATFPLDGAAARGL